MFGKRLISTFEFVDRVDLLKVRKRDPAWYDPPMNNHLIKSIAALLLLPAGCESPTVTSSTEADASPPGTPEPVVTGSPPEPTATPIRFLAWNIESGGNDPAVIASQLEAMSGYDVICLCEVSGKQFERYAATKPGFTSVESETGRADRMQILFDASRFELLEKKELHELNNDYHRSPMFVRLRDQSTAREFIVMVNHLARRDAKLRERQAAGVRDWARDQTAGVICIGDFNMDFDFDDQKGNSAFVEIMADNVFTWAKPAEWIDTNWADPDGDGKDNYPRSMLDFAFLSGPSKDWAPFAK